MVKIKYIGISGSITSGGVQFKKGLPYEVKEEVAKYLTETFTNSFEVIEEPKPKLKVEVKPKEEVKKAPAKKAPAKKAPTKKN